MPIIEIKVEKDLERKAYIGALQKADTGEYRELEIIISKALNESIVKTIKK